MKTIELSYKIEEKENWKKQKTVKIKSNLADDQLVECEIAESLINSLLEKSVALESDKFILMIAEAQKREIQLNIEQMDEMAVQAKIHSDKVQDILLNISEDAEVKFAELEEKFSDTEKRFKLKIESVTETIQKDLSKLSLIEEKLNKIDNWSLEKLTDTLNKLITLANSDPELMKLVLNYKKGD